jgi:hypothetical protein
MPQNVVAPVNGESLANYRSKIEDFVNAYLSGLSGATRPSNLVTGGIWFDTATQKPLLYNGAADVPLGGLVAINTTQAGNVGTGEDDLQSITIPANTLWANGQYLEVTAIIIFADNLNSKTPRLYFGGTNIFEGRGGSFYEGLSGGAAAVLTAKIFRTGASSQKIIAWLSWDTTTQGAIDQEVTYTATTADLTTSLIIKTTGEATANDDIVSQVLSAKLVF